MSLRYGLVDGTAWTLQAIAEEFSITRERVRQLVTRIMRKLTYKRYTAKPGSAAAHFRQYLHDTIRPGEPGDIDRLAAFVQDELAHLPVHTHVMPLLNLLAIWARASGAAYSESNVIARVSEWLAEPEAALHREAKVARKRQAFQAFLDASVIWPTHCRTVSLPLALGRQRDVNPESQGQVGTFESEKLHRPVQYESLLERQFLLRLEQSEDVVFYQEQPFRISYTVGDNPRVYIPDVFFVLSGGRGVVVEVKARHQIVLAENLRKWPVLRAFCEEQGYGRLVTDGRTGIRMFWQHLVPQPYEDALLDALSHGPLTWPEYDDFRARYAPTWNDFIALILQHQLVWSLHPFRLEATDRSRAEERK